MNTVVELDEVYIFPVSFAQQRLWLLDQLQPNNPAYNIPAAIRVKGRLNVGILARCLKEIVRRHEVLRTTFATQEGEPVQVIAPILTLSFPLVDLSGLAATLREDEVRRWVREETLRSFDLRRGPLLRATVLRLAPETHIILFTMHHIISDGWSVVVLIREMAGLYLACDANKPSPLPELTIQYADFAQWQRDWLQGEVLETQLNYWSCQLAGLAVNLDLPTDYPRPPVLTSKGSIHTFSLDSPLKESLLGLSHRQGVTLFMTLLAGFQIWLHRWSGQEDIVVGSPVANRTRAELEPLIGFFVNTLVIRTHIDGNLSFQEILAQVRNVTLGAYAHQDLPFEQLVAALRPERDLSRSPLFQVMFVFQNLPTALVNVLGLTFEPIEIVNETTQFDLTAVITETPQSLKVTFQYCSALFDSETIQRWAERFGLLLEALVAQPELPVSQPSLLTSAESDRLLVQWNQTNVPYPQNRCLSNLFEEQVERTPDAVALVDEGVSSLSPHHLTYAGLNQRAGQLAQYLQTLGVKPEQVVAVCLERSLNTVISFLGALKSGGVYLPLDPAYPAARLAFMLEDSQAKVLLTQSRLLAAIPFASLRGSASGWWLATGDQPAPICLDTQWETIANNQPPTASRALLISDNAAYIIYTSGSTGKPKGVLVEQRGLGNLAEAQIRAFGIRPESRVLQFASPSFDASISEIVITLLAGASLHLIPKERLLPGPEFIRQLSASAITVVTLPPSVLAAMSGDEPLPLESLILAGEACSAEQVKRWASRCRLLNAYGPTEATVCATIEECVTDNRLPPIGRPMANTEVYILDRRLKPVPIGVPGELYLGGVGLARGYLGRPDLTAERFIPNPFAEMQAKGRDSLPLGLEPWALRLYRTGDLARYRSDGKIEFLGRIDHQVKLRGFRIELGEIEAMLEAHSAVRQAIVLAQETDAGKCLVAYVVAEAAADLTVSELRRFLQQRLPDYMLPSAFVFLEKLPLNPNGKIDRQALPSPDGARPNLQQAYVAPRNTLEYGLAQVWQDVLKVERVGLYDNFFELGGDSLKAAVVINRLQHLLDRVIYLAPLFQAPTIADLAAYLTEHFPEVTSKLGMIEARDNLSSVVGLQAGGSRPPFFCVHPISGEALPYHTLARYLDPDQPAYAFQAPGLYGEAQPLARLEDLAALYVESLQQLQPEGPYRLGGWSLGGLVAFEMAQQLAAQAQRVSRLVIMDTCLEIFQDHSHDDLTGLLNQWTDIGEKMPGVGMTRNEDQRLSVDFDSPEFEAQVEQLLAEARRLGRLNSKITPAQARSHLQVYQANIQAARAYVPKPYGGSITFFRSQTQFVVQNQGLVEPTQRWRELAAGGVEVHLIPCEHFQMLEAPYVQTLARQLQSCLEKTRIENRFGPSRSLGGVREAFEAGPG